MDNLPGSYDFSACEQRWQAYWKQQSTFRTDAITSGKPKYYVLDMFPYPSGSGLHIGHPEGYTASDILARYKKANGYNVLHPMGWDAFGLPAEQHAIATGEHPAVQTRRNIDNFRRQLQMLGFAIDWDRELSTTDENYFRWTQWIFLKLFRHGLAYVSEKPVWFCPALGTVLANEEVISTEMWDCPALGKQLTRSDLNVQDMPAGKFTYDDNKLSSKDGGHPVAFIGQQPRSDRGSHPVERRP
ncbi:MAG: hypothetical protein D4R66_05965, partial [Opitutales bacterium]